MEQAQFKDVNNYLVHVFDEMLRIEETSLKESDFHDLSMKEMHTIAAIGLYGDKRTSQVAKELHVTVGTLTVSVNTLVKKGYVLRVRQEKDRRVVNLKLTNRGRLLYRLHDKFHRTMVKRIITDLDDPEVSALLGALKSLSNYLSEIKI